MDRFLRWIALALLFLSIAPAMAQTPRERTPQLGVPYLIPPSVVKLDEAQRESIASIRRDLAARYCELSVQIIDVQEELRALLVRQPPGSRATARVSRRIDALRDEIAEARAAAMERAEEILTPSQRKVLARWQEGQRGKPGELEDVPYTVVPSIKPDEPDIEDLEDPSLEPEY